MPDDLPADDMPFDNGDSNPGDESSPDAGRLDGSQPEQPGGDDQGKRMKRRAVSGGLFGLGLPE